MHSFWLPENIVELVGPLKLKKYKDRTNEQNERDEKSNEQANEHNDDEELFHIVIIL